MSKTMVQFILNAKPVQNMVEPRIHLIDCLRECFDISSARVGCEHGVCGACTLRINGQIVRGCLTLAIQVDGQYVETLEHLNETGEISDLKQAFHERNAVQCGYCTSGMLITSQSYLSQTKGYDRQEIREHIAGNYCRCTGYEAIVDAIEVVAKQRGLHPNEKSL